VTYPPPHPPRGYLSGKLHRPAFSRAKSWPFGHLQSLASL